MTGDNPQVLDYQPPPPRRRRWVWIALAAILAVAMGIIVFVNRRPSIIIVPTKTLKVQIEDGSLDSATLKIVNETDLPETRPPTQNISSSTAPVLKVYSFSSIESLDRYAATHPEIRQNGIYNDLKEMLQSTLPQTRPATRPAPSTDPATPSNTH